MGRRVVHMPATGWEFTALQRRFENRANAIDKRSSSYRLRERAWLRDMGKGKGALRIGRAIRLWGKR